MNRHQKFSLFCLWVCYVLITRFNCKIMRAYQNVFNLSLKSRQNQISTTELFSFQGYVIATCILHTYICLGQGLCKNSSKFEHWLPLSIMVQKFLQGTRTSEFQQVNTLIIIFYLNFFINVKMIVLFSYRSTYSWLFSS